ncbi:MAG: BON domain-containing protein [Wenzhouxiangella sp.]
MKYLLRSLLLLIVASQLIGCVAAVVGGAVVTGVAVHDRRTVGTVIDDNLLEVRVRNALFGDERFDGSMRIRVNAFEGWVLLAGEVGSQQLVDEATRLVSEVDGVQRLFNELAPIARITIPQSNNDRWISSRVNTSFTRIRDLPGFDPTRVQVTTARGVVYLQGRVSQAEADAVVERARTVRGVERVVMLFNIQNASS